MTTKPEPRKAFLTSLLITSAMITPSFALAQSEGAEVEGIMQVLLRCCRVKT